MNNFLKSTLLGLVCVFTPGLSSTANASNAEPAIRATLTPHVTNYGSAPIGDKYYLRTDACDSGLVCNREVVFKVQLTNEPNEDETRFWPIQVWVQITRIGNFFPAGAERVEERKLTIKQGRVAEFTRVSVLLDQTPETDGTIKFKILRYVTGLFQGTTDGLRIEKAENGIGVGLIDDDVDFNLTAESESVTEGQDVVYKLWGSRQPSADTRVEIKYAVSGDFIDIARSYTNVPIDANSGVSGANGYLFKTITFNTFDDEEVEPANGSITATILKERRGHSWHSPEVPLSANEKSVSVTVAVLNNDQPDLPNIEGLVPTEETEPEPRTSNPITYTLATPAGAGGYVWEGYGEGFGTPTVTKITYVVLADRMPDVAVEISVSKQYQGDLFFNIFGDRTFTDTFRIGAGIGTALSSGLYEIHRGSVTMKGDDNYESDGKFTLTITSIKEDGVVREPTEAEQKPLSIVARSDDAPAAVGAEDEWPGLSESVIEHFLDGVTPEAPTPELWLADGGFGTYFEGEVMQITIYSSQGFTSDEDYGIRLEILEDGDYLNYNHHPKVALSSGIAGNADVPAQGMVRTVTMKAGETSASFSIPTLDDSTYEVDGNVYIRLVASDSGKYQLADSLTQIRNGVKSNDTPEGDKEGDYSTVYEYLAKDQYESIFCKGSDEVDVCVAAMTKILSEAPDNKIKASFDGGTNMDVQSFVSNVGNSVNADYDLSDLVNIPDFAVPLTTGTEISGPVSVWGGNSRDGLGFSSGELAVGHLGLDAVVSDEYLLGMSVSALEFNAAEDVNERMTLLQPYAAYQPDGSSVHLSVIAGFGSGTLVMDGFGDADTSMASASIGVDGAILSYDGGIIDGNWEVEGNLNFSQHTVMDFGPYLGWTTIGRDASLAVVNNHTVDTPMGEFNPTVWSGLNTRDASLGGGFSFSTPAGLDAAAWFNGRSPDSAEGLSVDVGYEFKASFDTTVTPSASFASGNERYGLRIATDGLSFGGAVTDSNRIDIDGSVRW